MRTTFQRGWLFLLALMVASPLGSVGLAQQSLKPVAHEVQADLPSSEKGRLNDILNAYRRWLSQRGAPQLMRLTRRPPQIVLYRDQAQYAQATHSLASELAANGGFYDGAKNSIFSFSAGNSLQLIFHEYAHAMMGARFSDPLFKRYRRPGWPIWLEEGLAEYFAAVEVREGAHGIHLVRQPSLKFGSLLSHQGQVQIPIPLSRLLSADTSAYRGSDNYYATAHALVAVLMQDPNLMYTVMSDLQRLKSPRNIIRTLVSTVGGLDRLEQRLRAHVTEQLAIFWHAAQTYGGHEDSVWNWVRTQPDGFRLSEGIELRAKTNEPNLVVRHIPPISNLILTTVCDVEKGNLVLKLARKSQEVQTRALSLRLDDQFLHVHVPDVAPAGKDIKVPLPTSSRPAALALEIVINQGGGSIRVDGHHLLGFSPSLGPVAVFALGTDRGIVRTKPIVITPDSGMLPGGPAPLVP